MNIDVRSVAISLKRSSQSVRMEAIYHARNVKPKDRKSFFLPLQQTAVKIIEHQRRPVAVAAAVFPEVFNSGSLPGL